MTCGADALLLVPGPGEGTMPGKIYEYLRAGKPVLCLADEGPARELIAQAGIGWLAPSSDVEEIARVLGEVFPVLLSRSFSSPDVRSWLRTFDRREIAGRIAEHLNAVTGRGPQEARSGRVDRPARATRTG